MNTKDQDPFKPLGIIKKNLIPLTIILSFGFLLYACNEKHNPVSDLGDSTIYSHQSQLSIDENEEVTIMIADYEVSYTGKSYSENTNQTTFYYEVTNPGVTPIANKFTLEILTCEEPYAVSPETSDIVNNIITWNPAQVTSGEYSIIYQGELSTGSVNASLQRGNIRETKSISGPLCETDIDTYTISGYVFVDANNNKQKDDNESGIRNVTVEVLDGNDVIYSQRTSNEGFYEFTVIGGNYTVQVPESTDDESDFNEQLFELWNLTTDPPTYNFNPIIADEYDVNFGFAPDITEITSQFSSGDIELDTEDFRYWRKQMLLAINSERTPGSGNRQGDIPAMDELTSDLFSYLVEIENNFLLPNIFHFGSDKLPAIQAAYNILQTPAHTEEQLLCVELLTAELNIVSGRGSGTPELDYAIAAFGEYFAAFGNLCTPADHNSLMLNSVIETVPFTLTSSATLSDSNTLLRSFNGGGGGVGSIK